MAGKEDWVLYTKISGIQPDSKNHYPVITPWGFHISDTAETLQEYSVLIVFCIFTVYLLHTLQYAAYTVLPLISLQYHYEYSM